MKVIFRKIEAIVYAKKRPSSVYKTDKALHEASVAAIVGTITTGRLL
jgi:hypothetical protein